MKRWRGNYTWRMIGRHVYCHIAKTVVLGVFTALDR